MERVREGFGDRMSPEMLDAYMVIHINSFVLGWRAAVRDEQ